MGTILQPLFRPFYEHIGLSGSMQRVVDQIIAVVIFIVIIFVIGKISAAVFQKLMPRIFAKNSGVWTEALSRSGFPRRAAILVPVAVTYMVIPAVFMDGALPAVIAKRVTLAFTAGISAHIAAAFFDAALLVYQTGASERAKRAPIKGYLQLVKIFLYIISVILIITSILNVSPFGILSGVGAMSAVLMLVFKDLIIGVVSGMQLTSNDMIRIGDMIEMPKYGVEGNVTDITLHSVVVRNTDMSISTIPIYSLVSDSFRNWRGLADAEGRRVKRSLNIDMQSVHFLSPDEIERLSAIPLLSDYMREKLAEIDARKEDDFMRGRRLTNLGAFRAYTESYLKSLPVADQNMPLIARQLQPGADGIPLELYFFCSDKVWANYERIQADIFDHLLAVIKEFDLRVCQNPSGADLRHLSDRIGGAAAR
jgi:miniconductance mechanosensitive channel